MELIEKVLLAYVRNKKEELDLCSSKKWLLIADVFKVQWMVKILIEKHGQMVPVPHNMTNYFQQLNLRVNWSCQSFLHDKAQICYAKTSAATNFQRNCSRNCICWFENKHAKTYTHKMSDSVLQSYSHWRWNLKKWIAQIWDIQSD